MTRMKGVDIFCASQASTAICMSMDERSIVGQNTRAIDRHNPHLREVRRSRSVNQSSSQPSTKSSIMPYHQMSRKSISSNPTDGHFITPPESSRYLLRNSTPFFDIQKSRMNTTSLSRKSTSALPTDHLISPPGSSRYLLSKTDTPVFEVFDSYSALVPYEKTKPSSVNSIESTAMKPSSKTRPNNQVVVLRVSLHCKGCEGKVRKHISRMEGVTSFSIDFATKKVTVIGDVTPLSVLTSVSRVKNAQLWPSSSMSAVSVGSSIH